MLIFVAGWSVFLGVLSFWLWAVRYESMLSSKGFHSAFAQSVTTILPLPMLLYFVALLLTGMFWVFVGKTKALAIFWRWFWASIVTLLFLVTVYGESPFAD